MTTLEKIQEISSRIYTVKAKLAKEEELLERLTQAYLEKRDPELLEKLEEQKKLIVEGYREISNSYSEMSIKYLELSAAENNMHAKTELIKIAGERMHIAQETIKKAHAVFDSHNF